MDTENTRSNTKDIGNIVNAEGIENTANHGNDHAQANAPNIPANPWGVDINDPRGNLKTAAERLSIVRYVFLVQIEDSIATAEQRASLEYADAVLIGWPETDSPEIANLDSAQQTHVREQMQQMENYIARFRTLEHDGDIDNMTDTLIRITERVAEVRSLYQPDFVLPTFAEIRRVVQDEWDEDMGKIVPQNGVPTVDEIGLETHNADRQQAAGESAS